jgi:Ca2+-binding EF-hand superfamily protein
MKMITSIGERLAAKLGNANSNAFKIRRQFETHDADGSGRIHLHDLRMMMDSFSIRYLLT